MPFKDPVVRRERARVYNHTYYVNTRERDAGARHEGGQRDKNRSSEAIRVAKSKPCADCGKEYPSYVMDFDHLRDKAFTIGASRRSGYRRVVEEIEKCDVVCSNCHRERTHQRRKNRGLTKPG